MTTKTAKVYHGPSLRQCQKELGTRIGYVMPSGWGNLAIDLNCHTTAYPETHVRVTAWDLYNPHPRDRNGLSGGHPWACADGDTVELAIARLCVKIERGLLEYQPFPKKRSA